MQEKENIVSKIKAEIENINILFEEASKLHIKFDCSFSQGASFGHGALAHLTIRAYDEIIPPNK